MVHWKVDHPNLFWPCLYALHIELRMFRLAGKPGKAVDKEAEKKKARKQVYSSVATFVAIVAVLRLGKF